MGRHPIPLAKELATLQNPSNGRLILAAGVGWLEPEFATLGAPFHERGRRMDEGIALMRAVWTQDPVTFRTKYIPAEITDMTMTPLPVAPIPLWIGGSSDAALERTIRLADGWHGLRETPEQTAPIVQRLRAARPEADFTVSMRVNWGGRDLGAHVSRPMKRLACSSCGQPRSTTGMASSRASDGWSQNGADVTGVRLNGLVRVSDARRIADGQIRPSCRRAAIEGPRAFCSHGDQTMQVTTDAAMSPLILCDRLLSLAQDADRAGLRGAAEHLLELVGVVLESEATASAQSRFLAKLPAL
jgi:hypothetical protein